MSKEMYHLAWILNKNDERISRYREGFVEMARLDIGCKLYFSYIDGGSTKSLSKVVDILEDDYGLEIHTRDGKKWRFNYFDEEELLKPGDTVTFRRMCKEEKMDYPSSIIRERRRLLDIMFDNKVLLHIKKRIGDEVILKESSMRLPHIMFERTIEREVF